MNMGELCQCEVLSDDDGAEYCRGGVQLLASLQVPHDGPVRDEDLRVWAVAGPGEVPGDGAGGGQHQRQAAPVGLPRHVEEDILRGLVQSDDVHLLLLRVGGGPAAARGLADSLVEWREVSGVERSITATGQARRQSGESQEDVVGYYHENFHPQLCRITGLGVILSYFCRGRRLENNSFSLSPSLAPHSSESVFVLSVTIAKYCVILQHLVDTIFYCVIMAERLTTGGAETQIKTAASEAQPPWWASEWQRGTHQPPSCEAAPPQFLPTPHIM